MTERRMGRYLVRERYRSGLDNHVVQDRYVAFCWRWLADLYAWLQQGPTIGGGHCTTAVIKRF